MSENLTVAKYESLSGIAVELTADTVRQYLCRGNGKITEQEVAFFIRTCQAKQLDPLENGEVYLIKYDDKAPAQIVVGKHAYLRRADKNPEYRGKKSGIGKTKTIVLLFRIPYCLPPFDLRRVVLFWQQSPSRKGNVYEHSGLR